MTKIHQNYVTLFLAFCFGIIVFIAGSIWNDDHLWQRSGFAATLFLVSRDVLAGASIDRGKRSLLSLGRWIHIYYLALYFGIFMLLLTWAGFASLPELAIRTALGAGLFGLLVGLVFEGKPFPYTHHFETDGAKNANPIRKILYLSWPLLGFGLAYVVAFKATLSGPSIEVFFTSFILIGFLMPKYARIAKGPRIWVHFPRLFGFLMALAILGNAVITS